MTTDDAPARISEKDLEAIREICERRSGPPKEPVKCTICEDYAVVWWPLMRKGTPDWILLRCHCDQPKDWGPVMYWIDGKDEKGRDKKIKDPRSEWRMYSDRIPYWTEFRDAAGRAPTKQEIYSASQKSHFDTHVAEMGPDTYAAEERAAIREETDYSFEGNVT